MAHLHPHHEEELEYQAFARLGAKAHDRMEAEMGARWNDNWQDEFILTSHDVWVSNPCYHGPAGFDHPEMDPREVEAWEADNPELVIKFENERRAYYEAHRLYDIYCEELGE